MKRAIVICIGLVLVVLGAAQTWWWWQAVADFHALAGSPAQPTRQELSEYEYLSRALPIIGIDPFAPPQDGVVPKPAELARQVLRRLYLRMALWIALGAGGLVLIGLALVFKQAPREEAPQTAPAGSEGPNGPAPGSV